MPHSHVVGKLCQTANAKREVPASYNNKGLCIAYLRVIIVAYACKLITKGCPTIPQQQQQQQEQQHNRLLHAQSVRKQQQRSSTLYWHNHNSNNSRRIRRQKPHQQQQQRSPSPSNQIYSIMGSINCKEYVTQKPDTTNADSTGNGAVGSYQSTCEPITREAKERMANEVEYTEPVRVCHQQDIKENEMKQVDFDEDTRVLLIKQNGQLKAIGAKCTHYGAPLHTGTLGQGRVRCPWHGACFNIETGDIEDFPGLDSLPCYNVEIAADGGVMVRAKRKDLDSGKRLKNMVKRIKEDERTFIVVGGGPSGAVCVETLRQEGYTGRLVFVCREPVLPYDRVKISKSLDIEVEKIQFRDAAFYAQYDIEVMLGVAASRLDTAEKTLHCSNGYAIKYDKIYLATGCSAFKPPIPGADLKNVMTVREHADGAQIMENVTPETRVVCLGSSFIALEAAAYLVKKVASVTIIGRDTVPLKPVLGEQIGARVLRLFEENAVVMRMQSGIAEVLGDEATGKVTAVRLTDDEGTTLPCDLLIMGTGARLNTQYLANSGVRVNRNGSVDVTDFLESNVPDVYVGGDIANAHIYGLSSERVTIGHYQLAQYHGRVAAINMSGAVKKLQAVPFFFTMVFGKGIRYAGHGHYTEVVFDGDLESLKFVAYFLNERDSVVAVATCGRDPVVAQFAELLSQGKCLTRADIEDPENRQAWTVKLAEH